MPSLPHVSALVVACSDGRFREATASLVENHLGIAAYDCLFLPGGAGALSPSGIEFARAQRHLQEARFLVRAHDLRTVVLLFHGPAPDGPDDASCGDYRRKFPQESARDLLRRQEEDAAELLRAGLGTNVVVRAFRLEATNDGGMQARPLGPEGAEPVEVPVGNRNAVAGADRGSPDEDETRGAPARPDDAPELEIATLGGGCFWCLEAVFRRLRGVQRVVSGYAGGAVPNPSYELVCTGATGHAEVVQVTFDPAVTTYYELLEVFFSMHDPTTLNRQGPDVGTQYRSIILTHSDRQRADAETIIEDLSDEVWKDPVVTEIVPFDAFYPAEPHHQDYYRRNPTQPYCQAMIEPKVVALRRKWAPRLKPVEP